MAGHKKVAMNATQLLKETARYIAIYYADYASKEHVFHQLDYLADCMRHCKAMIGHYRPAKEDTMAAQLAVYFYGTGFLTQKAAPVERSIALAKEFLSSLGTKQALIDAVVSALGSTMIARTERSLIQHIVNDAVHYFYGSKQFLKLAKLLRSEKNAFGEMKIGKIEWLEQLILLLDGYRYGTDFCSDKLDGQKTRNIALVKAKIDRLLENPIERVSASVAKKDRPEKGIETMFRITSGNNQRLSDMADNKAHILITVNAIILSAIISLVLRRLEDNQFLVVPSLSLLIICLATMILSILATRPKIASGVFTQQELDDKRANLLYFGNFYKIDCLTYTESMFRVMNDSRMLYTMLIRDVHGQGMVLGKKYKLLRSAYNIFMYGIIITVLTFISFSIINQYHTF